LFAKSVLW